MVLPIILCKNDIAPNTQPRCGFGAIPFLPRISFYLTKYNIVYMPDGYDAVQINTTFVAPTATLEQYGTPLIIGTSASVDAASIQFFNSLNELLLVYDAANYPSIAKSATALANNGVSIMAVGTYKTSITELYDLIEIEARTHSITSMTVAGFTLDETTMDTIKPSGAKTLIEVANENQLILVLTATPPSDSNSITATTIAALREEIISPNVYFVAYNDPAATDDIAAAVLGVMETIQPQITMMWKPVVTDITAYFNNNDVRTLENAHVNVILQDLGLSESYTTDMFVLGMNQETDIITDISNTRSIYSIKAQIQEAIINLRRNTIKLGYTNTSLNLVSAAIKTVLEANKTSAINAIGMIDTYSVTMPLLTQISAVDRAANLLRNVIIEIVLVGEIKRFRFDLVVSLGGN